MAQQIQPRHDPYKPHQLTHQVAKTTTAVTLGRSLMVLSDLTLPATVIRLVLATLVLVLFSPMLVPVAIAVFLILVGFVTSGGFGAMASFVFYWMYSFSLEKLSGEKCYILAARDLDIVWADTPQYWRWVSLPESRFSEVAELLVVCWFEIWDKINLKMLSRGTNYVGFLFCKLG